MHATRLRELKIILKELISFKGVIAIYPPFIPTCRRRVSADWSNAISRLFVPSQRHSPQSTLSKLRSA
jgi:hypothetical protein